MQSVDLVIHFSAMEHPYTGGGESSRFSAKFLAGVCRPQFQYGTVG